MCLSIAIRRPEDVLAKGEHLGHEWMVVHNGIGYRCGYVRVPVGHPWHGKDMSELDCRVHGGVTFTEPDESCGKGADDAWWVGFDCCHCDDAADPSLPGYVDMPGFSKRGRVRSQEYVENECRSLCEQAASAVMCP